MFGKIFSALVPILLIGNALGAMTTAIDLTHTLSEEIPLYPGKTPFSRVICAYYQSGYRLDDIALNTGIGTHMDAPNHFCSDGGGIDTVSLSRCFGPACVIHLADKVQTNADYAISQTDIEEWEAVNGEIPGNALVLFQTGWDQFWETDSYCKPDSAGICHYPGVSEGASHLLTARGVGAIGIDTMSIDVGINLQFIAHKILLGAGIPLVENLTHLDELPATGATVYILPVKIKDAPEAPVRAVALIENR